jgi:hypothetical protein
MAAISSQSMDCSVAAGSSNAWHSKDNKPDTSPNKPTAAVENGCTRRVSRD